MHMHMHMHLFTYTWTYEYTCLCVHVQMQQRRELLRLLRSLHEIGTHRQLVSVFSAPPDDDANIDVKATRFCDDLLQAILRSFRIAAASHARGGDDDDVFTQ